MISRNIDERFPIFGVSGAIVFGVLTWLLLAVIFRATPEVREEGRRPPGRGSRPYQRLPVSSSGRPQAAEERERAA